MQETSWNEILKSVLAVCSQTPPAQRVVAFDADGTLWPFDLGETYFKHQISKKWIADLPADPWQHYRKQKSSGDPRPAYAWLAQIHKGYSLTQVHAWADEVFLKIPGDKFFPFVSNLMKELIKLHCRIYIVTASVRWAIEPGALALGLKRDSVLGVETLVDPSGIVTDQVIAPITYREGKVQKLLLATGGVAPLLAFGNSEGDKELLESASRQGGLAVAITSTRPGHELYATESKLQDLAKQNSWHRFSIGNS